jgi:hypothetical protein
MGKPDYSKYNVLVAVPAFGGMVQYRCTNSLIQLGNFFTEHGIAHRIQFISNDALIPRVRTRFANIAVFDPDKAGRKFTHLLFIDADIQFNAPDILTMLTAEKPIIALPYSKKGINWQAVANAAKRGIPPAGLHQVAGVACIDYDGPFDVSKITQIRHAGTGAMLIQTSALIKMAEAHPEWKYKMCAAEIADRGTKETEAVDFFRIGIYPGTSEYLSEDYFFIEDARKCGFETYLVPWAITNHTGSYEYMMCFPAIAQLG